MISLLTTIAMIQLNQRSAIWKIYEKNQVKYRLNKCSGVKANVRNMVKNMFIQYMRP
jgi:hypothetical protein